MHQREFFMSVRVGDIVYINTRSKRYCGRSGVVTAKEHRRAKVRLNDHIEQWFSFYTLDRSPVEVKKMNVEGREIPMTDICRYATNVGNVMACPNCKRVLFDYKNTVLDIEQVVGRCKHCGQKVKWDLRKAREEAEE